MEKRRWGHGLVAFGWATQVTCSQLDQICGCVIRSSCFIKKFDDLRRAVTIRSSDLIKRECVNITAQGDEIQWHC